MEQQHIPTTPYTESEERWNTITHGIGTILAFLAMLGLMYHTIRQGDWLEIISVGIYGLSLVILYLASTSYHAARERKWKDILRKVDKLCIYLLIAGTYTPVALLGVGGNWGWGLCISIWVLTLIGFIFQFSPLQKYESLSLLLYAAMGWLSVIGAEPLLNNLAWEALALLVAGGIFYTSGIYFYVQEKIHFNHVIWHVFVLAGSVSHFLGIYVYILE